MKLTITAVGDRLYLAMAWLILLMSMVLAGSLYYWQSFANSPLDIDSRRLYYNIPIGASASFIAHDLHAKKVLKHPRLFLMLIRLKGLGERIQAGEYFIEEGTTPNQLLEQFVSGRVILHAITFIEGWTFTQLMRKLLADDRLQHVLKALTPSQIMAKLGLANLHPEGQFFPDTYFFYQTRQ